MKQTGNNKGELRLVRYDAELMVEAYQFRGVMQAFPNHFHEYYVIGFIERGKRNLNCKGQDYVTAPGDLLLFNPGDNHACVGVDGQPLDYRCLNLEPDVMRKAAYEITGNDMQPVFSRSVVFHSELVRDLRELHSMILRGEAGVKKQERFYLFLEQLIDEHTGTGSSASAPERRTEVREVCDFLSQNYGRAVTLDELSAVAGLSKYHLLRAFTRETGLTPYSYLETIRIDRAKTMLREGETPAVTALATGFSDQSHFTNVFKRFIGLTPGQYRRVCWQERIEDKGEPEG